MNLGTVISHTAVACLLAAPVALFARTQALEEGRRHGEAASQAQRLELDRTRAEAAATHVALDSCTAAAAAKKASRATSDPAIRAHVTEVLRSHSYDIESATGYTMLDTSGNLIDLDLALCRLQAHTVRRLNLKPPYAHLPIRRAIHHWLGIETAVAVANVKCKPVVPLAHAPQSTP